MRKMTGLDFHEGTRVIITIDNIGSRMDWKRDHVHALNQHKPCRRVRVARELQLPMLYWPILWKFGGKELTDLLTLACM